MDKKSKQAALVLIIFIIAVVILISMSLPQLAFQPGMPLPELNKGNLILPSSPERLGISLPISKLVIVIFLVLLAIALLLITYKAIKIIGFKKITTFILSMLAACLVFTAILVLIMFLFPPSDTGSTADVLPSPEPRARMPIGSVPGILIWILGICIAGLAVFLGVRILTSKRSASQGNTIELIEMEAQNARDAILKGANLKDVIVRCYRQMTLVWKQETGMDREECVTVEEFEILLIAAGAPSESVGILTRLFEAVRYGNWQPGPDDEEKALDCFENIIQVFKDKKTGEAK
jgi:hypothetical protein